MADSKSSDKSPAGRSVEVIVTKNGNRSKVAVEKGAAEGLPPGWTKEVRIKKKGRKVRRDPYYTDPHSGYVFRSLKDALRYVETGEVGRHALKPKDNENEVEDNEHCFPAPSVEHKLEVSQTCEEITEETGFSQDVKDEQIDSRACKRERLSSSEHLSDQYIKNHNPSSTSLPDDKQPEKLKGSRDFKESSSLCAEVETPSDKQSSERRFTRSQAKRGGSRSKEKKEVNLPQRSSKRLAGIALEPAPELKTINRARRTVVEQPNEAVLAELEGLPSVTMIPEATSLSDRIEADSKPFSLGAFKKMDIPVDSNKFQLLEGLAVNVEETGKGAELTKGCNILRSVDDLAVKGANLQEVESNGNETASGPLPDLPIEDLWKDPCIAFAIKTLTESSIDASGVADMSAELEADVMGNRTSEKPAVTTLPQDKHNFQEKGPEIVENSAKNELPYEGLWDDPCIEFAIKTLTGSIPVGSDTSLLQASDITACQGDCLSQQHDITGKPVLLSSGKIVMESSTRARSLQQGQEKRNGCHP